MTKKREHNRKIMKMTACSNEASCHFYFIPSCAVGISAYRKPMPPNGGTLRRQFSDGKQRTVNVARNSKLPKTCRRKRDSKTVGFGIPFAHFAAAGKVGRPAGRNSPPRSAEQSFTIFPYSNPLINISTPIRIKITPPSTDAFPARRVPMARPMARPARQMAKVTAAMISAQTSAAAAS